MKRKNVLTILTACLFSAVLLTATACSGGGNGESAAPVNSGTTPFSPFGNTSAASQPTEQTSVEAPPESQTNESTVQPSVVIPSVAQPSVDVPSVAEPSVVTPSVVQPSVAIPSVAEPSVVTPSVPATSTQPIPQTGSQMIGTYTVGMSSEYAESLSSMSEQEQTVVQYLLNSILTLNEDGTLSYAIAGKNAGGTWTDNGDGTVTIDIVGGNKQTFQYQNGVIYSPDDMSTYFQKQ